MRIEPQRRKSRAAPHRSDTKLSFCIFLAPSRVGAGFLLMLDLNGKKVLVLGLGETGMSMTRWLKRHGAIVSAADTRAHPPHAAALKRELPEVVLECGEIRDAAVRAADLIAISPGVDRRTPAVALAIRRGTPPAGDVELFAQALMRFAARTPQRQSAIILAV